MERAERGDERAGRRTWRIGDATITRILESVAPVPPAGFFAEATPEAVARHASWLAPHFLDADGHFPLAIQGFVVESCGRRILVDTCMGDREVPAFPDLAMGDAFVRDLAAAGFARDEIDVVLCTHLHFDHVGSNTMRAPDGSGRWIPTFPNARYLFARVEYEHWKGAEDAGFAATFGDAVEPVVEAGLAELVEVPHRVTDEVWLEPTPGHTPGHVAVHVASRGVRAMITGDLTHHPIQWAEVDWKMAADSDSAQAAATRRRLLAEHADGDLLVIGTHYADPCSGRLVRTDAGFRFRASPR
ncbi:MAG: MBL fold metallo-hydrolase [Myxococcales bacterium]|nr:MBL fold metallo-hydrolase [Myxococcales bacterium]